MLFTSFPNIGRKVNCYRKLCQDLVSEQSVFLYKADGVAHKVRESRGTPITLLNREEECDVTLPW